MARPKKAPKRKKPSQGPVKHVPLVPDHLKQADQEMRAIGLHLDCIRRETMVGEIRWMVAVCRRNKGGNAHAIWVNGQWDEFLDFDMARFRASQAFTDHKAKGFAVSA